VRIGSRTAAYLVPCAAAAAAAVAHVAIDVVGDYALPHDTYDNLAHSSREIVSAFAAVVAVVLLARGLRLCCEIAAANRMRVCVATGWLREFWAFTGGVVAASACVVPAMEWLDGRFGGVAVDDLDDAFGGSVLLGIATTVFCAFLIAAAIYAFAAWLTSHRDAIATIIETLLGRGGGANRPRRADLTRYLTVPRRRRTAHALRLCKRGPPSDGRLVCHHMHLLTEGDSRELRSSSRVARARCARARVRICRARLRGTYASTADRAAR
jgi:hypothetical protein